MSAYLSVVVGVAPNHAAQLRRAPLSLADGRARTRAVQRRDRRCPWRARRPCNYSRASSPLAPNPRARSVRDASVSVAAACAQRRASELPVIGATLQEKISRCCNRPIPARRREAAREVSRPGLIASRPGRARSQSERAFCSSRARRGLVEKAARGGAAATHPHRSRPRAESCEEVCAPLLRPEVGRRGKKKRTAPAHTAAQALYSASYLRRPAELGVWRNTPAVPPARRAAP